LDRGGCHADFILEAYRVMSWHPKSPKNHGVLPPYFIGEEMGQKRLWEELNQMRELEKVQALVEKSRVQPLWGTYDLFLLTLRYRRGAMASILMWPALLPNTHGLLTCEYYYLYHYKSHCIVSSQSEPDTKLTVTKVSQLETGFSRVSLSLFGFHVTCNQPSSIFILTTEVAGCMKEITLSFH
jgi:hypothetical protein